MKFVASIMAATLLVAGCEREDFETKPKITVISYTPDVVPNNGSLTVNLSFTDKEGDVDSVVRIIRRRENLRAPADTKELAFDLPIGQFPNTSKGEIELRLSHKDHLTLNSPAISLPGSQNQPDTLSYRFYVKDAKGNTSDTVALDKTIVVIR